MSADHVTDEQLISQPRAVVAVVLLHSLITSRADSALSTDMMPAQAVGLADKLLASLRVPPAYCALNPEN